MDSGVLIVGFALVVLAEWQENTALTAEVFLTGPDQGTSTKLAAWVKKDAGKLTGEALLVFFLAWLAGLPGWRAIAYTVLGGLALAYLIRNHDLITRLYQFVQGGFSQ